MAVKVAFVDVTRRGRYRSAGERQVGQNDVVLVSSHGRRLDDHATLIISRGAQVVTCFRVTFGIVELGNGAWLQVPIVGVDSAALREGNAIEGTFVGPGGAEAILALAGP